MRTIKKDEMKTKLKIHCIEAEREGFDDLSLKAVQQMIGHYEPENMKVDPTEEREVWSVKMIDDSWFECETHWQAQIMASQEEIKAMLMELLGTCTKDSCQKKKNQ